jgi:dolichol-phosphate mannosyltransferase
MVVVMMAVFMRWQKCYQRGVMEDNTLSQWSLAIACPMANEHDSAVEVVKSFLDAATPFHSVTFVAVLDNASTDGTVELLRAYAGQEPRLKVVFAPENKNGVEAYLRAYKEALDTGADWVLEIDAGFSHRPYDLKNFFPAMENGFDAVFGTRFANGGKMVNCKLSRHIISQGGTWLANLLLNTRLSDMTSGYEMFRRHVLENVLARGVQSRGHFFQTEIKAYCHAYRIAEAPIVYSGASSRVSGSVLKDAFHHLWRLFKLRCKKQLY